MPWVQFKAEPAWRKAPYFTLPSNNSVNFSLESLAYRNNPVLVFLQRNQPDKQSFYFDLLENASEEIGFQNGNIVFILGGQKPGLLGELLPELEAPLLLDRDREVWNQYQALLPARGDPSTMVFILDRYGSLVSAFAEQGDQEVISGAEIINWLEFIELQCPE